jgi:hypothetical protein
MLKQLSTLTNVLTTGVGVHPVGVVTQQVADGVGVGRGNAQASYDGVGVGVGVDVGVTEIGPVPQEIVFPSK